MQQAGNAEFIVWAIVAVVVMVAKGLGKLATPADETSPVPPLAPRSRVQPRSAAGPARHGAVPRRVPPVARPIAEVTPPVIPSTTPVVEEKSSQPAPVEVPPAPSSRAHQWAVALRDRQNIRNVIIANEIIGRPVALREP